MIICVFTPSVICFLYPVITQLRVYPSLISYVFTPSVFSCMYPIITHLCVYPFIAQLCVYFQLYVPPHYSASYVCTPPLLSCVYSLILYQLCVYLVSVQLRVLGTIPPHCINKYSAVRVAVYSLITQLCIAVCVPHHSSVVCTPLFFTLCTPLFDKLFTPSHCSVLCTPH